MADENSMTEQVAANPTGESVEASQTTAEAPGAVDGQNVAEAVEPKQDEAPAAPESYSFTAPEGQEYDSGVIEAFSSVAKELNLTQDAASKILETVAPVMAARHAELVENQKTEWMNASKADKEFGGDRLNENLAVAAKALDMFGTPELKTLLNESGLGNHPEIIRAFLRAGKAVSDDSIVNAGSGNTAQSKSLYPNSNMKP